MIIIFKIMDFLLSLFEFSIQIKIAFSIFLGVLASFLILCSMLRKEYRIVITEMEIGNDKLNSRLEYSILALSRNIINKRK